MIETNNSKERVIGSELLLAIMLVVPILSALGLATMLLEYLNVFPIFTEFDDIGNAIDDSIYGPDISLSKLFSWFPQAFFCFESRHLLLGIALIQHAPKLPASNRTSVIWFGLYAVDWEPSDTFVTSKAVIEQSDKTDH
ncbi:MAG: hypothetical protein P8R37_07560 [Opitutae bacterium]|nr:hypothetical protein [Opitutae bacterium]MDG1301431.1 hypothetical protein [Opitutae bacterium]